MSLLDDIVAAWNQTAKALHVLQHADDLLYDIKPNEADDDEINKDGQIDFNKTNGDETNEN